MATNVSEKDKTLNEIIDWCENQRRKILADIEQAPGEDAEEAYADLKSAIPARCLYDVSYGDKRNSYRRRPASEMLYAMIEANGKRTN